MKLTLQNAPIGTKAPAIGGGFWERTRQGWKWCTGSTFQTVGGDWNGKLILTCPMCGNELPKGEMVCCGIWHEPKS
jgi:hypothetical protein